MLTLILSAILKEDPENADEGEFEEFENMEDDERLEFEFPDPNEL